ncbi:MAG: quinone oxidoreductase, partial [Acidihalobacter sp.]
MPKAIRIHENGGPEVMRFEEVEIGRPGPGEVLLSQAAVGLNYIDVYHRNGLYPVELPSALGMEGAGRIEEV